MSNHEKPFYAYCEILQENVRIFPPLRPVPEECSQCFYPAESYYEGVPFCEGCLEELLEGNGAEHGPNDEIDDIDPTGNYYDNDNDFDL